MHRLYLVLRNFFCGSLAVAVIASGRVRRARNRALNGDVVTAIYFHNPNKKLFARCVQWLTKNGYTFISADGVIKILRCGERPPEGAVWLSFDDGFKELVQTVVPLIRQHQIPITVFIPSGIVGGEGLFPWLHHTVRDSMTAADVRELASYPEVSIGSHTVGHKVTVNLTDEQTRFEFGESKRVLESWTGRAVECFAYPEGRLDGHESCSLAECGYQLAATTEPTFITRESDPYLVPRFHVGDDISFPEAVCNMVGVWRPAIDPFIKAASRWFSIIDRLREPYRNYDAGRGQSAT